MNNISTTLPNGRRVVARTHAPTVFTVAGDVATAEVNAGRRLTVDAEYASILSRFRWTCTGGQVKTRCTELFNRPKVTVLTLTKLVLSLAGVSTHTQSVRRVNGDLLDYRLANLVVNGQRLRPPLAHNWSTTTVTVPGEYVATVGAGTHVVDARVFTNLGEAARWARGRLEALTASA